MNATLIASGLLTGTLLTALSKVGDLAGMMTLVVSIVLFVSILMMGRSLPLWPRITYTVLLFDLGVSSSLVGRTMEPVFSMYTFSMSLSTFAIYTLVPAFLLLRAWSTKVSLPLLALLFPLSLTLASLIAFYEERQFIANHPDGAGLTPRWTVPHHWLAYNAQAGELNGSD